MKKIFLIALVALIFAGCEQATIDVPENPAVAETPTPDTPTPDTPAPDPDTPDAPPVAKPYYVKNSKWEDVDISRIPASAARSARAAEPSVDEALKIIAEYNAANNDDQLHLYTENVPIKEAPTVDVYIVNEGDYVVLAEYLGLDRADFVARRADFAIDERGFGGILFVDKIPPVPIIPPDLRTPHEKYHIQMVNKYNKIVVYNGFRYEESCEETWASFNGTGPSIGYPTVDDYFSSRVSAYEMDIRCVGLVPEDAPWRVVSGQIYTEPPAATE